MNVQKRRIISDEVDGEQIQRSKKKKENLDETDQPHNKAIIPKNCMDPNIIFPPFKEEFLQNKMAAIYVDVPWTYRPCGKLGGLAENQYPCLTMNQLKLLKDPIQKMAAKNCALLFWSTGPKIGEGIELIEHWGFTYKTVFLCWEKLAPNGNTSTGLGFYTRSCYEFLLIGTKGAMTKKVKNKSVSQKFAEIKSRHSAKPDGILEIIESVFDFEKDKKIELFARRKTKGWECWGNDPSLFGNNQPEEKTDVIVENDAC
jgi:N6-adenosine-specific RNA methylase IME4